jgi:hypothetical protein
MQEKGVGLHPSRILWGSGAGGGGFWILRKEFWKGLKLDPKAYT